MLKTRLIPVLLLKNGILVRSKKFSLHQSTGNHIYQLKRFSEWKADEIIYLDISREDIYDINKHCEERLSFYLQRTEEFNEAQMNMIAQYVDYNGE